MFDSVAGSRDGRLAARGNAASFMLPWQAILRELRRLEKEGRQGPESAVPRVGEKLGSVVQLLLKINDATTKGNLSVSCTKRTYDDKLSTGTSR